MPDVRAKALAYLREGQVRAHTVATPPGASAPSLVVAAVHGHTGRHSVTYDATRADGPWWSCSCWQTHGCAHIAAVAIWSGAPNLAARTIPTSPRSIT